METEIRREWITYEEARCLVGLSRTTLWRIVKSEAVKSASVGRAARINRVSLEEYMEREARGGTSEGDE